jgi:hypothetical protein
VLMEVPDMGALQSALGTERAVTVMAEDGVRGDTLVMLVSAD